MKSHDCRLIQSRLGYAEFRYSVTSPIGARCYGAVLGDSSRLSAYLYPHFPRYAVSNYSNKNKFTNFIMDILDRTVQHESKAAIILSSILLPVCTFATILRLSIRFRDVKTLKGEDWCALASLLLFYAYVTTALLCNTSACSAVPLSWRTFLAFHLLAGRSPVYLSLPDTIQILRVSLT